MLNALTETVTASGGFFGNLTGNADTASVATLASTVTVVDTPSTAAGFHLTFVDAVSGDKTVRANFSLTYNPSTTTLSSNRFSGILTGNVTGDVIGNVTGNVLGDVKGSLFADDSTLLVDGLAGVITGNVDNSSTDTDVFTGRSAILSGTTLGGVKAGLKIETDGNADDSYDLFTIEGAKSDPNGMSVVFNRFRGTPASKLPLVSGDEILGLYWFGADTNTDPQISSAILASVDAAPSVGIVPGNLILATADSSGTITPALTIDSRQVVEYAANVLTAGGGSGQVNAGSVATYLEVKVAGVTYAMPLYGINP
jgi:hypothetical protein